MDLNLGSRSPLIWVNHGNRRATAEFPTEELSEFCFLAPKKIFHVLACFYLLSLQIHQLPVSEMAYLSKSNFALLFSRLGCPRKDRFTVNGKETICWKQTICRKQQETWYSDFVARESTFHCKSMKTSQHALRSIITSQLYTAV